jgi:macrolide transport system ATP-binding/permease protein
MLTDLLYRLRSLCRPESVENELHEELQYHLEREAQKYRDTGISPLEAMRRARIAIGGPEQVRQQCREQRGTRLIDDLLQDLRFALRQLCKSPGFTFTAIAVFALGIAASTAIFAFVDAALVKPLAYRDPSRLVGLFEKIPVGERYHLSYDDYLDWKRLNRTFASLDVYEQDRFTLNGAIGVEQALGARVSDGFFRTLGVVPFLGRDFRPGEDQPSAEQTVILSYSTWQKRFGANKNIIGQTTTLDGVPYLIVGVLPAEFSFTPVEPAEFWATLHGDCRSGMGRECRKYYGVARLKPRVTLAAASADIASIAHQIAAAYPKSNGDRSSTVISLADVILGNIRPILVILLSGAGLLLLIGLVNVSSLLLVRAESRRREIALRGALGASRLRLIRQFVVEGFLLAASGCALGLASTFFAVTLLKHRMPPTLLDSMPYLRELNFSVHLILFAVLASVLGGLLFSAAPSLQLFADTHESLIEGGRTSTNRSWRKASAILVVAELAIAVVLLVSATLLGKSYYRLMHEDIGISADNLAILHVLKVDDSTDTEAIQLERQLISRMSVLPGVTSVGVSWRLAVGNGDDFSHFRVVGRSYTGEGDEALERITSVGYFKTLQARLAQGRYFTEADDASKPRIAIINQALAKQFFPGEDPIGKHLVNYYDTNHPIEIVGVVNDIKEGPLDVELRPAVYTPFNQTPETDFFITLRTSRSEETILPSMINTVHQVNAGLVADGEDTMTSRINNSQSAYLHRFAAWIVGGFATLALLLATVGLYGVVSHSVGQRTREIGVRIALGAQRRSVYQLILKEAAWLATSGVAGGILCSIIVTGLLRSLLFGVSPWDAGALLSVACMLIASALLAAYIPARRAASVNPVEALRAE